MFTFFLSAVVRFHGTIILFHFHESPNPECPVGRNIHALLDDKLKAIQGAMEEEMRKYTLLDLRSGITELLEKES